MCYLILLDALAINIDRVLLNIKKKMKNNYAILILTFLNIIFITCSGNKDILEVNQIDDITGTWSETFDWEGRQPSNVIIQKIKYLKLYQEVLHLNLSKISLV